MKSMNYYEDHAEEYLFQVRKVDMSSLYVIFLSYLPKKAKILDVLFGSCRDMAYFSSLGYEVEGIDSCKSFVKVASLEGFLVLFKKVEDLEEKEKYDAIWASASLLHCQNLSDVFFHLYCPLKREECFTAVSKKALLLEKEMVVITMISPYLLSKNLFHIPPLLWRSFS